MSQRVLLTYVDGEDPVVNVYQDVLPMGALLPEQGALIDFGTPVGNSMRGTWRVLSLERPYTMGAPSPDVIRVNILRAERYASD